MARLDQSKKGEREENDVVWESEMEKGLSVLMMGDGCSPARGGKELEWRKGKKKRKKKRKSQRRRDYFAWEWMAGREQTGQGVRRPLGLGLLLWGPAC